MARVFLSYSRQNLDAANRLVATLEEAGHQVWIDREGIRGGAEWQEEIVRAIREARYFVLVVSPDSVASTDVRKELSIADRERKRIFPVILRPVDVPDAIQYSLVNLQWVDLSENFEDGVSRLLQAFEASEPEAQTAAAAGLGKPVLLKEEIQGSSDERRTGAMVGALCWGIGGCVGAVIAAAIASELRSSSALILWNTTVSAVFGAAFGSIFKKRIPSVVTVIAAPIFGLVLLGMVLWLFFWLALDLAPGEPLGLIAGSAAALLGAGTWMTVKFQLMRRTVEQLKKTGRVLQTQYKGVVENQSITFNGRHPMQIVSQWRDPTTNQVFPFYSKNLWFDPSQFVDLNVVTVYIDPKDASSYYMDISFLPKLAK